MNYSIKVDLAKLPGAAIANIKGRSETRQCLIVPLKDSLLYRGAKGLYLNLTAVEIREPKYSDSHLLKIDVDRQVRDQMTEEQLKALPIMGGLRALEPRRDDAAGAVNNAVTVEDVDDLPF